MQTEGRAPLSGDHTSSGPVDVDRVSPSRPTNRRLWSVVGVAVGVVVLDQLSKFVIVQQMATREPIVLLGGLLTITYTRNPGAAFSLGTGFTFIFTGVAIAVVVVILRTARRLTSRAWAVALGALLGGAVGNLLDRFFRAPGPGRGYVVDWIQLPHFAVFNLADSAITCAAAGIVLLSLLGRELDGRRSPENSELPGDPAPPVDRDLSQESSPSE